VCVCVWLWVGSWWVVVVWVWTGGWVVCVCGAGVVGYVGMCVARPSRLRLLSHK